MLDNDDAATRNSKQLFKELRRILSQASANPILGVFKFRAMAVSPSAPVFG